MVPALLLAHVGHLSGKMPIFIVMGLSSSDNMDTKANFARYTTRTHPKKHIDASHCPPGYLQEVLGATKIEKLNSPFEQKQKIS